MMTEEQLIDRICLTCVDVRHAATDESAQKFINDIRGLAVQLAALTQPASQALNLPDGWVAVPVEPTEEMIVDGFESEPDEIFSDSKVWEEYDAMSGCQQAAHRALLCWQAMLSAAPAVPHTAPIEPICATGGAEWVKVPRKLTADNGAKSTLIGEFKEEYSVSCPECFGEEECETCDGSGRIHIEVPVSWTTIKAIWDMGVEHFTTAPEVK